MEIHLYVLNEDDGSNHLSDLERKRNELLDVYSLYLRTRIPAIKEEVIMKAFEIHLRDPKFSFVV